MTPTDSPARSVFDCNVFLQAMANPGGPAGTCFSEVRAGNISLFLSRPILQELIDVAARPVLVRKLALSPNRAAGFVDELLEYSTLIDPVPAVFTHPKDPKGSMYVDLAIAANAQLITSRDRHLLSLRNSGDPVGVDFMSRFPGIEVLTPVQLLKRIRS